MQDNKLNLKVKNTTFKADDIIAIVELNLYKKINHGVIKIWLQKTLNIEKKLERNSRRCQDFGISG